MCRVIGLGTKVVLGLNMSIVYSQDCAIKEFMLALSSDRIVSNKESNTNLEKAEFIY